MKDNFVKSADATPKTTTASSPSWFNTALDTIKFGVTTWSQDQQLQAQQDTAAAALKLEQLKLQQLQAQAAAKAAESSATSGKIKAYAWPIAITGLVVAGGIAVYFIFKKKKVA